MPPLSSLILTLICSLSSLPHPERGCGAILEVGNSAGHRRAPAQRQTMDLPEKLQTCHMAGTVAGEQSGLMPPSNHDLNPWTLSTGQILHTRD